MAAPPLANTFEGGTDGVAITSGNSGGASGNAFDSVTGTPTYSNQHPHVGSMGFKVVDAAATHVPVWSGLGSLTGDVYFRGYMYLTARPTGNNHWFMRVRSNAADNCYLLIRSADGFMGGSVVVTPNGGLTGSVLVPVNAQFRWELRVRPSVTAGEIEWRLYTDPDSLTIADTKVLTGQVIQANVDRVDVGVASSPFPTTPYTSWHDDLAVSTAGWIGPSVIVQRLRPDADLADGGWTTTPLWSKLDEESPGGDVITATAV